MGDEWNNEVPRILGYANVCVHQLCIVFGYFEDVARIELLWWVNRI